MWQPGQGTEPRLLVSHSDPSDKHCRSPPCPNLITLMFAQVCAVALETEATGPGAESWPSQPDNSHTVGQLSAGKAHPPPQGGVLDFRSRVEVCLLTLEHVRLLVLGGVQLIRKALQLKFQLNLSPADRRQGTQTMLKKGELSSHPARMLLHLLQHTGRPGIFRGHSHAQHLAESLPARGLLIYFPFLVLLLVIYKRRITVPTPKLGVEDK